MEEYVKEVLASTLLRILETDPSISVENGIERVLQLVPDIEILTKDLDLIEKYLNDFSKNLKRKAIINPNWLSAAHDINFQFFLVNAQPGWLSHLVEHTLRDLGIDVSYYILYGVWDSLIILYARNDDAFDLSKKIQSIPNYDLTHFSARSVPLFHRYNTPTWKENDNKYDSDIINKLVEEYDQPDFLLMKEKLENEKVILGPIWDVSAELIPRVSAYVGISLKGWREISTVEVLKAFFNDETLKTCLVHLFEVDKGFPFHYLAKLVCRDMNELDRATDAIGYAKIDHLGIEGNTFIIASGNEKFPTATIGRKICINPSPNLGYIEEIANDVILNLGSDAISTFNDMDGTNQLIILFSLTELQNQANNRSWDEEREKSIRKCIDDFTHSCLQTKEEIRLSGPVMEICSSFETYLKHALRKAVESVYGHNYSLAQKELKLSNKDFRKITIGKAVHAFQTMRDHQDFKFLASILSDGILEKLENFSKKRNIWAHGDVPEYLTRELVIDNARRTIIEGIELIRWIGGVFLPAVKTFTPSPVEITIPPKRENRLPSIFISYSKKDREVAENIATGLKALSFPVFYDRWSIAAGESIVEKINESLAMNDTLILLLSPNSIKSKWVQTELNVTLIRQLSGGNVKIIPVLIKKCKIPTFIKDIKYIDISKDLQKGFIKILETLKS